MKILLVFDAELPWKWYIDWQTNPAKVQKTHICIHNATQGDCSRTITITTVLVLTIHGLDAGAESIMKKKILSWCIRYSEAPFHNEPMLKFLLSFFPLHWSSKCLVYSRNEPKFFHIMIAAYFAFSLQHYLFATTYWLSLNFSKFLVSSLNFVFTVENKVTFRLCRMPQHFRAKSQAGFSMLYKNLLTAVRSVRKQHQSPLRVWEDAKDGRSSRSNFHLPF